LHYLLFIVFFIIIYPLFIICIDYYLLFILFAIIHYIHYLHYYLLFELFLSLSVLVFSLLFFMLLLLFTRLKNSKINFDIKDILIYNREKYFLLLFLELTLYWSKIKSP